MRKLLLITVAALLLSSGAGRAELPGEREALEPLELDLPNPPFVNLNNPPTLPEDIVLGPASGRPREPFLAPVDVENVALGKAVTASAEPEEGELALLTDGDKESLDGQIVVLPEGPQWVQVDLGQRYALFAIVFWQEQLYDVARDVVVRVSNDAKFERGAVTLFSNDHANTHGHGRGEHLHFFDTYEGKLVPAHGLRVRYLRIYTNGSVETEINVYTGIEVWGRAEREE